MKKILFVLVLLVLAVAGVFSRKWIGNNNDAHIEAQTFKNGDIIFQTSTSSQSKAIQLATNSKYSHCGIIYKKGNSYFVFEAIQPVQNTPLTEWISRGKDGKYVLKRLKNADNLLTPTVLARMETIGKEFAGKDYDLAFGWSDEKIYCSELIWKIYKRSAGIEIGTLETLKDFDIDNPTVKAKLRERYGRTIPNDELVISPASMFDSNLLLTVSHN